MIRPAIATLLLLVTAQAAQAQETIVQLSPEAREKALEAAAVNGGGSDLPINGLPSRQIHGEVGMAIGTGGMRSVYGTVVAPIGDDATAAFSYENTRYRTRAYRNGRYY